MPRYEFVEGTSKKFWKIELNGASFVATWGRIGTEGQSKQQLFADAAAAKSEYEKLISSKVKKGYRLVDEADSSGPQTVPQTVVRLTDDERFVELTLRERSLRQRTHFLRSEDEGADARSGFDSEDEAKEQLEFLIGVYLKQGFVVASRKTEQVELLSTTTVLTPGHPEYEAACLGAPEDPTPWRIYADWLQGTGDLRGEFAVVVGNDLTKARAFVDEKRDALLAQLSDRYPDELGEFTYLHGFLQAARLKCESIDSSTRLDELTRDFLALPFARFVTRLRFGLASFESNNDWTKTLEALLESRQADQLRRLDFDDYTYEDCELSWTAFGDFSALWKGLPALEHLKLRSGAGGNLGSIVHPRLKTFIRESGGLAEAELDAIVNARWPALEHLEVWTGSSNYGADATEDHLRAILDRAPAGVRHLGLVNSELSRELLPMLAGSPLLARLKTLDLSKGVFTDAEVAEWVKHAARFRHLERLDLSENLFQDQYDELKAALPNVVLNSQREHDGDDEDRYVAVGE